VSVEEAGKREISVRILWLAHRDPFAQNAGGAERTVLAVTSELFAMGHEVEVVCGADRALEPFTVDGVRFRRFKGGLGPHLALPAILKNSGSRTTVVDDLAHVVPWISHRLGSARTVVFFRHRHGRTLGGQVSSVAALLLSSTERLYPSLYRGMPFVTESLGSARDLVALGQPASCIRQIRPGVDLVRFHPGRRAPEPRIIYFAGLKPYKRPQDALLMLSELRKRGVAASMTITGESTMLPYLRQLAEDLGLRNVVTFTGRLTDDSLAQSIRESWLSVVTSVAEGWCYAASESIASGVPVVAYNVPGLEESVDSRSTGILVREPSPTEMADAALQIVENIETWHQACQHAGRARPWQLVAKEWEEVLSG